MSIKSLFLYLLVWIISEYLIGNDMEENWRYPVWGVTLPFAWKILGITRRTSGQDGIFPGRDLKPGLPTWVLPTRPCFSAYLHYQSFAPTTSVFITLTC